MARHNCQNTPEIDRSGAVLAMPVGCQQKDAQIDDDDYEFCYACDKVHKVVLPDSVEIRI